MVWLKGPFKGMPLYSLTLEERATCDSSCPIWDNCYGNHMPFASRFDVTMDQGAALMALLSTELTQLDSRHPDGYSIRLHVLGDFFSTDYVYWWRSQLTIHPLLHIFGYTHRTGPITTAIDETFTKFPDRFVILQSDSTQPSIRPVALIEGLTPGAELLPLCPEQAGQLSGCLECGLCTNSRIKGVRFRRH